MKFDHLKPVNEQQALQSRGPVAAPDQSDQSVCFMREALREARRAARLGEVPIGAVIVREGLIIARGSNRRETRQDVTLHAELVAIRQACRRLGSWRLQGCQLYVTLEPCIMCAGAIVQARISDVYYGATDPKAGAAGSIVDIFAIRQNHQVRVQGGLLADSCKTILQDFFRARRQLDKATGSRAVRRAAAIAANQQHQLPEPAIPSSVSAEPPEPPASSPVPAVEQPASH